MKLWSIALFLFIFGAGVTCVNELSGFDAAMPGPAYEPLTEAEVQDLSEQATTTGLNPLYIYFVIQTFGKALFSGFLAILTILPLFCSILAAFGISYAVAAVIGMVFQLPIWYVEIVGIYQMITGYNMQGME